MNKLLGITLSVSALSACAGGGDQVAQAIDIDATVVKSFGEDAGVVRYVATASPEDFSGHILGLRLDLIIEALENAGGVAPADIEQLPVVQSLGDFAVRTGTIDIDGNTISVEAVTQTGGDTSLILLDFTKEDLSWLLTAGLEVSNIPSGTVDYSGHFVIEPLIGIAEPEIGQFTLTADFDAPQTITFAGETPTYRLSGTADISGSTFASDEMVLTTGVDVALGGMAGEFYGDGANSVAGVVYGGGVRGGFVGPNDNSVAQKD